MLLLISVLRAACNVGSFRPECPYYKRDEIRSAKLALLVARAILLAHYANKSLSQNEPRTPYTTQYLREPDTSYQSANDTSYQSAYAL